MQIQFNF